MGVPATMAAVSLPHRDSHQRKPSAGANPQQSSSGGKQGATCIPTHSSICGNRKLRYDKQRLRLLLKMPLPLLAYETGLLETIHKHVPQKYTSCTAAEKHPSRALNFGSTCTREQAKATYRHSRNNKIRKLSPSRPRPTLPPAASCAGGSCACTAWARLSRTRRRCRRTGRTCWTLREGLAHRAGPPPAFEKIILFFACRVRVRAFAATKRQQGKKKTRYVYQKRNTTQ